MTIHLLDALCFRPLHWSDASGNRFSGVGWGPKSVDYRKECIAGSEVADVGKEVVGWMT